MLGVELPDITPDCSVMQYTYSLNNLLQEMYMNRFLLVRHAENTANLTGEFSCRIIDYPLTEKGRLQAQQTAEYLQDTAVTSVYASPLKRTIETAEIIAAPHGLPVRVLEEFREVNIGDLEGTDDLDAGWDFHRKVTDQWFAGNHEVRFPGGEDYLTLLQRMMDGYRQVQQENRDGIQVIVAHGGVINLSLPGICPDVTLAELHDRPIMNCSITDVLFENGSSGRMLAYADFAHLHGEAAQLVSGVPYWKTPFEELQGGC